VATKLTLDQMKKFVREHFVDFVKQRNAAVIGKNMTPDFYDHDGPGGKRTGLDGDEQMMIVMYKSMPDLHVTIEDMIAEGDKVMCRNVWRWTDTASGQKMQFHGFVFWRFEEEDRRTLGHSQVAGQGNAVDKRSCSALLANPRAQSAQSRDW
jgi:predicted ester cyclase